MKSLRLSLTAAMGLMTFGMAGHVHAQMGMGLYNPPVSPYLNILRGGASPAINWFNIVQPQMQFGNAIGALEAQQGVLGQAVASQNALGTATGHPVMFGNYSHYYGMSSRLGMGGSRMGGMGMGGMGMGGMGMGGMGMGGMGMGGMGMGGMGMGGMGMGGMGMGGLGR
ncbi:MAG TPA: hypothetical protein VMG10_14625 [Gemmataceae bacterium]|nr:hypothetical protein [Gemmataceae bacterium]